MKKSRKATHKTKSDKFRAREQHLAVIKFLNWAPVYTDLMQAIPPGEELQLMMLLLQRKWPVFGEELAKRAGVTVGAISQRFLRLNKYLKTFSQNLETLKTKHIIIEVPRRPITEAHFGYYLACYDSESKKYLTGPETFRLFHIDGLEYLFTAEKVLKFDNPPQAVWFRDGGPLYSDFEEKKFYRRPEVETVKKEVLSKTNYLLVGEAATAKTVIIHTLLYELYKEGHSQLYYSDIAPRRYFDESQMVREIRNVHGIIIIDNIHLEAQKVQLIYEKFRNDPDRQFLFTSRRPPEKFQGLIRNDLREIKRLNLRPFDHVGKLIERHCSDPEIPSVVWEKRQDILKVSRDDFWWLAFALRGCAAAEGKGEPQSWVAGGVKTLLEDLESCRDEHDDQYPGILVALSPLYKNEVLTAETYLRKLGFIRPALNGLVEREEITRQTDSKDNFLYGLTHSSRADAYWEHGRSYIEQRQLRKYEEFIYDYAISDVPNGLQAILTTEAEVSKLLLARLETEGKIAQVVERDESLDIISYSPKFNLFDKLVLSVAVYKQKTGEGWDIVDIVKSLRPI